MWAWISGGVYKCWCVDALEGSFALNLIVLAASTLYTLYISHSGGPQFVESNQLVVGYTSVSIALATFIGIFMVQLANVTGITQYLKRNCTALRLAVMTRNEVELKSPTDSLPDRLINPEEYEPPF